MDKEIPNCMKKRTFYNLFDVFDCNNCSLIKKDEEYIVGENKIYIYHLNNGCILNKDLSKDDLVNSKKMRLFLKDAVLNQENIIVLWLDSFDLIKNEFDFLSLASFDVDVHIIVF